MSVVLLHGPAGTGEFAQAFDEYGAEVSAVAIGAATNTSALPVTPDAVPGTISTDVRLISRSAQVEALGELTAAANWHPVKAGVGASSAVWPGTVGAVVPVRVVGDRPHENVADGSWSSPLA